jgi:molybdate-binding protein
VPVTWEDFDIVLSADAVAAAEPLISALRESAVQASLDNLGGYDLSKTGSVQFLS